jgi:hypothetical protein
VFKPSGCIISKIVHQISPCCHPHRRLLLLLQLSGSSS